MNYPYFCPLYLVNHLRRKKNIRAFTACLLMVLYLVGISPSMIIHHHTDNIVPFAQATTCEKAIYYGIAEKSHYHHEHLSKTPDSCWICDHHTVTPLVLFDWKIAVPVTGYEKPRAQRSDHIHSVRLIQAFNKDPPTV